MARSTLTRSRGGDRLLVPEGSKLIIVRRRGIFRGIARGSRRSWRPEDRAPTSTSDPRVVRPVREGSARTVAADGSVPGRSLAADAPRDADLPSGGVRVIDRSTPRAGASRLFPPRVSGPDRRPSPPPPQPPSGPPPMCVEPRRTARALVRERRSIRLRRLRRLGGGCGSRAFRPGSRPSSPGSAPSAGEARACALRPNAFAQGRGGGAS
jgi:hypothetical protein